MKKVVIFNSPAGSGKDACAFYLKHRYKANHLEFKNKLFEITQVIFGVDEDEWNAHYTRDLKEKPWDKLEGLSPRQALIKVSEDVIKPQFGKMYFGKALANQLQEGLNAISDGGFEEELLPVIESVGKDNILIVKIKREGCSFAGDSRSFLDTDKLGIKETWIDNNGSFEDLHQQLDQLISMVYL